MVEWDGIYMIPIKNIYYMLSYAFQILNEQGYKDIETEQFDNIAELYAAILTKGITTQIKRGLGKEYISQTESLSVLRGKIDLAESIRTQRILKKQIVCTYDDFSINSYTNRIIKTTVKLLLSMDISKKRKKELNQLLLYFRSVELINLDKVNWNFQYNRNNRAYQMLISVCYLVFKGLLQSNSEGTMRVMDFFDEQSMHRLFEKFVLEYYRKEFPQLTANASQIHWKLDDGEGSMLPIMQSDIMLTYEKQILIVDTKFYINTTQVRYHVHTIHSNNLYQIFTYVKNKAAEYEDKFYKVSGLLLYAKTDEIIQPDNEYYMDGNKISVKTLDLNCPFSEIAVQLNHIIEVNFDLTV